VEGSHGGGRCLRRGVLGLGDRVFSGGLGDRHGTEMGFQRRQHSEYQANASLPRFIDCFCMTTSD
jgi:hypothetical protein